MLTSRSARTAGDGVHDSRVVGSVDAQDVARLRAARHLVDRADGDGLERELVANLVQSPPQLGLGDRLRKRDDQHHREVAAQDRHLRVLDVPLEVQKHLADRGDDPGPVTADGAECMKAHRA